jgi:hypothetical protein
MDKPMKYKPTGALRKFVDVAKKDTRVLGSIERYLLSKPKDKSRRTDVLHPSEMAGDDWCYRASYFQLMGKEEISTRTIGFKLMSIFEEGHNIHRKWQSWFHGMGVMYGKWYCHECEEMFWGGSDCHDGPLEYREVPLFYEPLRIFGHADGWLVGLGDPLMLEIKSVGVGTLRYEIPGVFMDNNSDFEATWKTITAPFKKHITQVQIYMKLAELLGYENVPQEAVIIYEAKPNQEVKEFVVPKSDWGITHIFEAAQMIVDAIKNEEPPICNITSNGCSKCKGYTND